MKSRGCVSSSLPDIQEEILCGSCAFNGHTSCHQLLAILPKDSSRPSHVHHMACIGIRRFAPPQSCACTTAFSFFSLQRWLCKALVCVSVWAHAGPVPYSPMAGPHHPSMCRPVLPSSLGSTKCGAYIQGAVKSKSAQRCWVHFISHLPPTTSCWLSLVPRLRSSPSCDFEITVSS